MIAVLLIVAGWFAFSFVLAPLVGRLLARRSAELDEL